MDPVESLLDVRSKLFKPLLKSLHVHAQDEFLHLVQHVVGLLSGTLDNCDAAVRDIHPLFLVRLVRVDPGLPLAHLIFVLVLVVRDVPQLVLDVVELALYEVT